MILNCTGAPEYTWLLCLKYVCFILNRLACDSLKWHTPLESLTGSTPDISPLLRFTYWEPVYFQLEDADFPLTSTEGRRRWVGVAEHVGHAMTYMILTDDTLKVLFQVSIQTTTNAADRNKHIDILDGRKLPPLSNLQEILHLHWMGSLFKKK